MNNNKIEEYSLLIPNEIRSILNDAPRSNLDWAIIMYFFKNTKKGNDITLTKLSNYFDINKDMLYTTLRRMTPLWITMYINNSNFNQIYYSYELTNIAADFMILLIKLLEVKK